MHKPMNEMDDKVKLFAWHKRETDIKKIDETNRKQGGKAKSISVITNMNWDKTL